MTTTSTATRISAVDSDESNAISSVHSDIIHTHIFTRLDGPTLASASCASTQLYGLSTDESLWKNICLATWPSTDHPRMQQVISDFPNGSRSFFSDSFPLLISQPESPPSSSSNPQRSFSQPHEIISAVDLYYDGNLIFSKVQETETVSGWFQCSPFRIDLLDPKDVVSTPIRYIDDMCHDLEESLTLSWIIVDPMGQRAANLSSWRPVSVQRHWLTGEIQVRFATILTVDKKTSSSGYVQCGIVVTFGGEMQVREVSLQVEDMDGINLNGKDSLGIVMRGLERGERKKGRREEGKERYEAYMGKMIERREKRLRREGRLDMVCVMFGLSLLTAFWMYVMCR